MSQDNENKESIIPALMEKYHSIIKLYNAEKIKNNQLEATIKLLKDENSKLSTELKDTENNLALVNRKLLAIQMTSSELRIKLSEQEQQASKKFQLRKNSSGSAPKIAQVDEQTTKQLNEILQMKEDEKNEFELKIQHITYMNENKVKELNSYIEKLQVRLEDTKKDYALLSTKYNQLETEKNSFVEQNNTLLTTLNELKEEQTQSKHNIHEIEKQLEEIKQEKETLTTQCHDYAQLLFEQRTKLIFLENNCKKLFVQQIIPWKRSYPGYLRIYTSKENMMCLDVCINKVHHPHYITNIIDIFLDPKFEKRFILRYGSNSKQSISEEVTTTALCEGEYVLESEERENVVYILKQVMLYEQLRLSQTPCSPLNLPPVPSPYQEDILYDYESFFS